MTLCAHDGCGKRASYGVAGGKAEYCAGHAPTVHENVTKTRCIATGCSKLASYGMTGSKKRQYCSGHAPDGFVNVITKTCIKCGKIPHYGLRETGRAEYCVEHAPDGSENLKAIRCARKDCGKTACFGPPGTRRVEYCAEHAPTGSENLRKKCCAQLNCTRQPIYGSKDGTRAEYCSGHAPPGYKNVKDKTCTHEKCEKLASYGEKTAEFCSEHAPETCKNVKAKYCAHTDCQTVATYGVDGSKTREYCHLHAPLEYTNIKAKRCIEPNCGVVATYGAPTYSPEYCAKHKLPNHILRPTKVKTEDFKTCEFCESKIHYKQSYCESCKTYLSLGKTVKRHEKELAIKALLERNHFRFTHDSRIAEGCSKYRPDFVITHPSGGKLVLEVDEFQHNRKNYSCECELTRMRQIYFDVGGAQVMFVRYNPDSYKVARGLQQEDSRTEREKFLSKYLSQVLSAELESPLSVVYLYYDHFDKSNPETEVIEPYVDL
jgi:hypothetical protein